MTRIATLFLFAASFLASVCLHAAPLASVAELEGYGQGGYGGQTITCSSNDGKRNYCAADTRGGVRLSRQISGSPCVQGQTWGYDGRNVWVDRGCRAEFVIGAYRPSPPQIITCSSNDGKRNYCAADTRGGVRLSRQISGSACVQGQTWGYDGRNIWVDRGCRAEFAIGGGGGGGGYRPPPPPPQYQPQIITCSSNDGKRNYCSTNGRSNVRLSRQISGSPCVEGQTWGYDNRGLWVDRGCRADFQVR